MSLLKFAPAVFAVGREYVICVRVSEPCVMWIETGDECFYDDSNGILRSMTELHKITVPQSVLDTAGAYTVCYRRIIERKPYFSKLEDVTRVEYSFRAVTNYAPRAYHIADSHGCVESTVAVAEKYKEMNGGIDFLILNGDVIDHSGDVANFDVIYDISARITHGEIPIVFSRGNHDTRGVYAEKIADYTPTRDGFSYFTFRLGSVWGIVLDCAEDKSDENEEYGHTIACHQFRVRETKYLENIIANADAEYAAPGVTRRIVIAHSPFTMRFKPPFNIEEDIYERWTRLLSEHVKPDIMICGHLHKMLFLTPGCESDAYGQKFPVAVVSLIDRAKGKHVGGGFVFGKDRISAVYLDEGKIIDKFEI